MTKERPVGRLHRLKRLWASVSQPGTGGLIQPGDWRCIYPDSDKTRWMSHGDAANCLELWGGRLEWRGDLPPNAQPKGPQGPTTKGDNE